MIDKTKYSEFINRNAIIILSNQMRYTGRIISVGDDFLQIVDKYEKTVYIVLDNICSIEEEK